MRKGPQGETEKGMQARYGKEQNGEKGKGTQGKWIR